jgi:hypothetical protein
MARVKKDTLRPRCPRPGHATGSVWLYGTRGPKGHERPRWRCVPANGDKPHEFSETLPRQTTHDGFCGECERAYAPSEGPQGARDYLYPIRDVARALVRVGEGASYREAAYAARRHAERGRSAGSRQVRYSEHAQLVSDWIEVFAPVVHEPHRDLAWPATGSVVLDEVPFHTNSGVQGGARAFSILAAMGWDAEAEVMRLWRLEAVPERRDMARAWRAFLRSLEGRPERVVCDRGRAMVRAVGEVWPQSEVHYCEHHLKERCHSKLRDLGLDVAGTPPHDTIERAFNSVAHFDEMRAAWLAVPNPTLRKRLGSYLRGLERVVSPQLEHRSSWPSREHPYATGALEAHLEWLRRKVSHRAGRLTNKARLDRALLLMMLQRNGQADERAYAESIRAWLLAGEGRPRGGRRVVTDVRGAPSLRP